MSELAAHVTGGEAREGAGDWLVYRGTGEPHDGINQLPAPPKWRKFEGRVPDDVEIHTGAEPVGPRPGAQERARTYRPTAQVVEMVNAALYLRRPLLVTGRPGVGKSTLAHSVAYELNLGGVLYWPITSRSTLKDALYRYDAIGRLQEVNLRQAGHSGVDSTDIGRYIQLGPLGTALLPGRAPRVLLIDEFDKSDVDLPNDLLNIFEEGQFEIPELARLPEDQAEQSVRTADLGATARISHGVVRCNAFPFVVITSNDEREFPPAFLRRCLRLDVAPPDRDALAAIVEAQLGPEGVARSHSLIEYFLGNRGDGALATDQLLNAIYLASSGAPEEVKAGVMRSLTDRTRST